MSKFHIIGSGACGFLRLHHILKDDVAIKFKCGRIKYQNSFESWNDDGLIWDAETLSKEERLRRVSLHDTTTNITHSYLKYVPEFIELHPNIKFLCFKGEKNHSIKSLLTSWGYNNPCYVKDRELGKGHNRYAVKQFPNFSDCDNELEATKKYWNTYYEIANEYQEKYPDNFIIVDAPKFFSDVEYSADVLSNVELNLGSKTQIPVDFDSWNISTSLHGGLGNNLFQIGEVLSFCKKYNLPKPFFGIWDIWDGGKLFPQPYNCDRLLGGHSGTVEDIKRSFPNLDWRDNLTADFDTKFVINDMFRFGRVGELDYVREELSITKISNPKTASLHLRFSGLPADDHSITPLDDSYYYQVFNSIPDDINVFIFSDDNSKSQSKMEWFRKNFPQNFSLVEVDAFQSLKLMVECEYHILHVSTLSFWSAFLDINQSNNKVFYPKSFVDMHSSKMVPYEEWQLI